MGYKATMVDFGLSRVDHPISGDRDPYFTPIPEDVFSGVGDQWDVYRAIRDAENQFNVVETSREGTAALDQEFKAAASEAGGQGHGEKTGSGGGVSRTVR
jgi:hypothetical protein